MFQFNQLIIDRPIFEYNIEVLRKQLHEELCVVVKGNAYGHGLGRVLPIFYKAGIRRFAVYKPEAALEIRRQYPEVQILLLGAAHQSDLSELIASNIDLMIWDLKFLNLIQKQAQKINKQAQIHLEVETGMYRTGIYETHLFDFLSRRDTFPNLNIKGICTHFSGADEKENLDRIDAQLSCFLSIKKRAESLSIVIPEWHGSSSSASVYLDDLSLFTFARVGILAYGFFPSEEGKTYWKDGVDSPKPAISLVSHIAELHHVPQGGWIGYGKTFQPPKDMNIAMLPIGYADGFPRALSNNWSVRYKGRYYPILGRVNMNLIIIEASEDMKINDEVVIIESVGKFDWWEASRRSGRFIYELLCGFSTISI